MMRMAASRCSSLWQHQPSSQQLGSSLSFNHVLLLLRRTLPPTSTVRSYLSRAHPEPKPHFGIHGALQRVLNEIEQRKQKRALNWEKFRGQKEKRGIKMEGPYRNMDETVEFTVNLNVDPRKPGQMLRGSVALPHGSGKRLDCIVFTTDSDLEKEALAAGAKYAGGAELIDQIVRGTIPLESLQRALATPNMTSYLSKAARILGPRGLMPNAKVGTLLADHLLMDALRTEMAGQQVQYRTEKEGIIQLGIGKGSFTVPQLVDNVRAIMQELMEVKPESHGKSAKKKNSGGGKAPPKRGTTTGKKYLLKSHVTSTFGKSYRVDMRTLDPTNMYFMTPLPTDFDGEEEHDGDADDDQEEEKSNVVSGNIISINN